MNKRRLFLSNLKNDVSDLEEIFCLETPFQYPVALRLIDKFGVIDELKEDEFDKYFAYLHQEFVWIWKLVKDNE